MISILQFITILKKRLLQIAFKYSQSQGFSALKEERKKNEKKENKRKRERKKKEEKEKKET